MNVQSSDDEGSQVMHSRNEKTSVISVLSAGGDKHLVAFILQLGSATTPSFPSFSWFSLLLCVQTWAQLPASTPLELSPDLLPINSSPAAFKACGFFYPREGSSNDQI